MTEHAEFLTRREFVKILGPGLYILIAAQDFLSAQAPKGFGRGYPEDFNAYLRIAEDGHVTCYSGKVELGQGVTASLAQMLAEELEVPFESVTMVLGDTKLCPWDPGTNGSRSIKYFGPALRAAAAEAREVLIQLASEHLRVPAERLIAENGFVFQRDNPGNKVDYGSLTKGKTIERHLETKPPLKAASAFQVCGKSLPRADFQDKVTGKAQFAGDIRLPGMLYGKVLRPRPRSQAQAGRCLARETYQGCAGLPGGRFRRRGPSASRCGGRSGSSYKSGL